MNCMKYREIISSYIDDEISSEEKVLIEKHLKLCNGCRKYLVELKETITHINCLDDFEPDPWLTQRIMSRIRSESEKKSIFKRLFFPLQIKLPLEAFATLAIVLVVVFIYKTNQPAPYTEIAKSPPGKTMDLDIPITRLSAPQEEIINRNNVLGLPDRIFTVTTNDNELPIKAVEKSANILGAKIIKKELLESKKVLIIMVDSKKLDKFIEELKLTGTVKEKRETSGAIDGNITIRVEMSRKDEPF